MLESKQSVLNQTISLTPFLKTGCRLVIKREDLIHPYISGNKYRKLKYNLISAKKANHNTLLTFGGAYSNHIAAVASAGKEFGFNTIGVIRGEELMDQVDCNPTLVFAKKCGMKFLFISRKDYQLKTKSSFIDFLKSKFGKFYLIPEGGTNQLAVRGCCEILKKEDLNFDTICVSVGTGGTFTGLIKSSKSSQNLIGFSALKGTFQLSEISKYTHQSNFMLLDDYCFGGYAKVNTQLISFINSFKETTAIPLDPIYTGKMMFGIIDLIKKGLIQEKSSILCIHTGGLQGIAGMNNVLKKKNLPLIK